MFSFILHLHPDYVTLSFHLIMWHLHSIWSCDTFIPSDHVTPWCHLIMWHLDVIWSCDTFHHLIMWHLDVIWSCDTLMSSDHVTPWYHLIMWHLDVIWSCDTFMSPWFYLLQVTATLAIGASLERPSQLRWTAAGCCVLQGPTAWLGPQHLRPVRPGPGQIAPASKPRPSVQTASEVTTVTARDSRHRPACAMKGTWLVLLFLWLFLNWAKGSQRRMRTFCYIQSQYVPLFPCVLIHVSKYMQSKAPSRLCLNTSFVFTNYQPRQWHASYNRAFMVDLSVSVKSSPVNLYRLILQYCRFWFHKWQVPRSLSHT